jgi:flagellar biosynthesis chaperone FliJ
MILRSQEELDNTRKKLQMLEEQYEAARQESGRDDYVRELELQSLKGLINQLKEEIARFECRAADANPSNET